MRYVKLDYTKTRNDNKPTRGKAKTVFAFQWPIKNGIPLK